MVNVMVSLIGDQPAPNLFLMQDEAFEHIDRYLFITTAKMEKLKRVAHLVQAIGLEEQQYQKIEVQADNLNDLTAQLDSLELDVESSVYAVNITSGTKVMSIGTYAYFSQPQFNASIYYIPVRQDYYWQVYPLESRQELPFRPTTSIGAYLSSYGLRALSVEKPPLQLPSAYARQLFELYTDKGQVDAFRHKTYIIRKALNATQRKNQGQRAPIFLDSHKAVSTFLEDIRFPVQQAGQLSPRESQYLSGGWFEVYIHDLILQALELRPGAIAIQSKIQGLEDQVMASTSEFDVLFLHKRTLYVVECKTNFSGKYPDFKEQLENALYRLSALKKLFGMNAKASLVTLSTKLRRNNGAFIKTIQKRAEDLGVQIIDQPLLLQPPSVWMPILLNEKPFN
jgi:hypothetical protein